MPVSDEQLMRFADGELDPLEREAMEREIASDASLRQRVAHYRRQRERLAAAFAPVLQEPVPDHLRRLVEQAPIGSASVVVDLAERRARRRVLERVREWSWPEAGAVAASLIIGVLVAQLAAREGGEGLRIASGGMVAGPVIARALSTQLASTQAENSAVRVGLTFENQRGELCRTFAEGSSGIDGIACRRGAEWRVDLALSGGSQQPAPDGGGLRMAGSDLRPELLRAVESQIRGAPFDARAEAEARRNDWRTAAH